MAKKTKSTKTHQGKASVKLATKSVVSHAPTTRRLRLGVPRTAETGSVTSPAIQLANSKRMVVPEGSACRVRMYRQGLGDCFLLAFPTHNPEEPFYMLIDCGVLLGTENAKEMMIKVASDIESSTDGRIDALVVTHEHWDHVSGFMQAQEVFEGLTVKECWTAWTEEPGNPLAEKLRSARKRTLTALTASVSRLQLAGGPVANEVKSLLGFFGVDDASLKASKVGGVLGVKGGAVAGGGSAPAKAGNTEIAMGIAKQLGEKIRYCTPGEAPIPLAGVDNVRVFVLGPPVDERAIKHSDATEKQKHNGTVYHLGGTSTADRAFFAAAVDSDMTDSFLDEQDRELSYPFDATFRIDPSEMGKEAKGAEPLRGQHVQQSNFVQAQASTPEQTLFAKYFAKENTWRRVDGDWLGVAADLALKLDNDTNNTSLALAIELPGGGVLLFPGDAQVGNWVSWQNLEWNLPEGKVTKDHLLARTVLYKVGHHASHNATLRAGGLESMGRNMVAFIPVDETMAVKKKWKMPFPGLYQALQERTRGRVARVDLGVPTTMPANSNKLEWAAFVKHTEQTTALYIDYCVPKG
jgi:hypothetical protein